MGAIYVLRNNETAKTYVGQSTNILKRLMSHRKAYGNQYISRVIRKYGWEAFEVFVMDGVPNYALDWFERAMIIATGSLKPGGYNVDSGGSKLKRQHPDANKKRSDAMMGTRHPLYGTHLSDEAKKHLSDMWKGKVFSEETRMKIRASNLGRRASDLARKRMSESHKGKRTIAIPIFCVETGEVFEAIADACRKYKIGSGHLTACCKGNVKSAHGKHWRYMEVA